MKELAEHYDILKVLGHGGYSAVFKARSKFDPDKIIALKQMDITIDSEDSKAYHDFKEEVATLQKINHPNIVKVFDEHILDGKPSFEMEYIDGDTFETLKSKHHIFSIDEVSEIIKQLADALQYCHSFDWHDVTGAKGIIHNDINPKNIVKTKDADGNDKYVLIDFGLSFSSNENVRQSKIEEGMPEYKAPEKWDGYKVLPASDIYSFGATVYELLAGQAPFPMKEHNNAQEMLAVEQKHKLMPVPNICELRKKLIQAEECDIPDWMQVLIHKCLNKKPENRFLDGVALFQFYQKAIQGQWSPTTAEMENLAVINVMPEQENEEVVDAFIVVESNVFCEQQQFYIHKSFVKIGRAVVNAYWQMADIAINTMDNFISKNHCQIIRRKNEEGLFVYYLKDHEPSKNGTFYNRDKNSVRLGIHEEVVLKNGDYFWIGHTKIYFHRL